MRKSNWTPSIVPNANDQTVYLVADDFGKAGRAWVESDYETTDLEVVIQDLLTGQYKNPIRVIAFNTEVTVTVHLIHAGLDNGFPLRTGSASRLNPLSP